MKTFEFSIILIGQGETMEEAWDDAVAGFLTEPGTCPDEGCVEELPEIVKEGE